MTLFYEIFTEEKMTGCSCRDLRPTGINPLVLIIFLYEILLGSLQIEKVNKAAGGITEYDY